MGTFYLKGVATSGFSLMLVSSTSEEVEKRKGARCSGGEGRSKVQGRARENGHDHQREKAGWVVKQVAGLELNERTAREAKKRSVVDRKKERSGDETRRDATHVSLLQSLEPQLLLSPQPLNRIHTQPLYHSLLETLPIPGVSRTTTSLTAELLVTSSRKPSRTEVEKL